MRATLESNPTRYFAWLYSSQLQRVILGVLFDIEGEIRESLKPGLDHQVAHSRLQWWREECERAAQGRAAHPLTQQLVVTLKELPHLTQASRSHMLGGLSGFVDVTVWDLASATFETRRELTAYCERWAGAMMGPAVAESFAHESAASSAGWVAIGVALRELEMLQNLALEAHSGRLRIPLDELQAAHADPTALAKPPWPAALAKLQFDRYETLRGEIARILNGFNHQQQMAERGVVVWAALACRSSKRVQRALPALPQTGRFDGLSDAWFAWRAARRATGGRFRLS
jgi:phytoene synthase